MGPSFDMPLDAPLALDETAVFQRFASLVPLGGRHVLEIGGCVPAALPARPPAASWCSIDPRNVPGRSDRFTAIRGVVEDLPLADASVDAVFSCNCFQHVQRLDLALDEIARVLTPGGVLYANFGPIWSAPDGAHVEGLVHDGAEYDFWTHTLLPAWAHLVLEPDELLELLTSMHGPALALAVVEWLARSGWTNRLTLRDHARLFEASSLSVVRFAGSTEFGYAFRPPPSSHPLMRRLEPEEVARYAGTRHGLAAADLNVRDLEVLAYLR